MVRQLLLDQVSSPLPLENETTETISETTLEEDLTAYRDGLVTSYLSYLKAAGYCQLKQEIHKFELGAWRFISCFPDPTDWPSLDMEELRYCGRHERRFLNYLFLRRILPLLPAYLLTPRPHLYEMAIRLMEKETYQTYRKAAERLGYGEQDSKDQFRPLLCLMVWSQKPLEALTLKDLEDFIQALRTAFSASQKPRQQTRLGLPRRWDYHLSRIRNVLYHMGIFPRLDRSTRSISFDK
jgi:hypothetical protein